MGHFRPRPKAMNPSSSPFNAPNFIKDLPLLKELNSTQLEALKFGLSSTFLGVSSGLLFGSTSSLMRGLQDSPAGRANIAKSFKLFSIAGVTYGLIGSSLILVNGEDSYTNRMISGCSAGVSLGIVNRSLPVACVGCATLGALAALSKKFTVKALNEKSEVLEIFNQPFARKDEKWDN